MEHSTSQWPLSSLLLWDWVLMKNVSLHLTYLNPYAYKSSNFSHVENNKFGSQFNMQVCDLYKKHSILLLTPALI